MSVASKAAVISPGAVQGSMRRGAEQRRVAPTQIIGKNEDNVRFGRRGEARRQPGHRQTSEQSKQPKQANLNRVDRLVRGLALLVPAVLTDDLDL